MNPRLIIFGGSAGSLEVVLKILADIRTDPQIPIVFVFHRKRTPNEDILTQLLASKCRLTVKEVEDKEKIQPSYVYLAPADYHLLVENDGTFSLDISEKVNYSRPSIDVSFMTAADAFGPDLIAIILSGGNADGIRGLEKIKSKGGICVAQDPSTAKIPFMPTQAVSHGVVHHILSPLEMTHLLENPSKNIDRLNTEG